ncbi:NINE protein [Gloeothece verrucosa]|uniref:TM2 domain containing protein n=1 Tax=Gloeothece verrucosa (strain PCC 7822) TaxID=497965 RepID=E0U8V0_GLOV7|nr:NINE protein [Gloeothece verrucosa]ADN14964.1 TM2 domain containing protein [Gloeothece verrucosa PCC 7822]
MRNRAVAIVLAWFGGWFGIHKFYLGQNVAGVFYLLFCWTMIPGIIAFFEFFFLLFMSDQAFNAQYNAQYLTPSDSAGNNNESSKDKISALADLKKLYDSGIITAEEYEQKRRKFLDSL